MSDLGAARPVRHRRTARVLLLDTDDRLLLFADSDPGLPGSRFWITPGGAVEPGESDLDAAVRELQEETGLNVDAASLLGPLAHRVVWHGFTDQVVRQEEVYVAVRVAPFEVDVSGHTDDEQLTMTAHRWWTRAELVAADDVVWPMSLVQIWDLLVGAPDGDARDVDLGESEESTVPVGPLS